MRGRKHKGRYFAREDINDIKKLYLSGDMNYREIARVYGVGAEYTRKFMAENGIFKEKAEIKTVKWDDDELKRLYIDEKLNVREVAEALGFTVNQISNRLVRKNIKRRKEPLAKQYNEEPARPTYYAGRVRKAYNASFKAGDEIFINGGGLKVTGVYPYCIALEDNFGRKLTYSYSELFLMDKNRENKLAGR